MKMNKGSFKSNVLTLMTGTAIAQLMTVAISPVLTRFFSPASFGVYGVYLSIVSIATAIVTLRYDQALVLPKESKDAVHLFWASMLSVAGISGLSLVICILFFKQIPMILKAPELSRWIFFIPISILLAGIYQTLNSWSTRCKKFKRASISQVTRSATAASVQVSSGLAHTGPAGLIGGYILGDFFASVSLAFQVRRDDKKILKEGFEWYSIKRLGKQYSDFPVFSSTQNLLNAISQNIPFLLLAKFFGPAIVGYYTLGVRVLQVPMNFVLVSLRQVLFQKASEVYNSGGDTYGLFKKTTLGLMGIVIIPALLIILFGPAIFSFLLGKEWVMAGVFAKWLVLWLMLMFSNLPSILFGQIYRKQKVLLFQDIGLLFFRVLAILIGGFQNNPMLAIVLYSIVGVIFNLYIIVWAGNFIRKQKSPA